LREEVTDRFFVISAFVLAPAEAWVRNGAWVGLPALLRQGPVAPMVVGARYSIISGPFESME
jgi:hypothetical protein